MVEECTTRHLITLGSTVNSTKGNVRKYLKVVKETIPWRSSRKSEENIINNLAGSWI